MAKTKYRELAQKMRRSGESIKAIEKKLRISRSTVSFWCRDILLSEKQIRALREKQKVASIKGLLRSGEKRRKERLARTKLFNDARRKDVGKLSQRDIFLTGLSLYWGEGYKKGNEEFGFTNSDPFIIKFIIQWLEKVYGVSRGDLILRISINYIHRPRLQRLIDFWSKETRVSPEQFTKTSFIKAQSKKQYTNYSEHFGTLRVKVRRSTNLRRRIMGSIERLGESVDNS